MTILDPAGRPVHSPETGPQPSGSGTARAFFLAARDRARAAAEADDVPLGRARALRAVEFLGGLFAGLLVGIDDSGRTVDVLEGVSDEDAAFAARVSAAVHRAVAEQVDPAGTGQGAAMRARAAALDEIVALSGSAVPTGADGRRARVARGILLWTSLLRGLASGAVRASGASGPGLLNEIAWLAVEAQSLASDAARGE